MPEQLGIDDIVAHVEATDGWYLAGGCIRRMAGPCDECCPISSLEDEDATWWYLVADMYGLDRHMATLVAKAADRCLVPLRDRQEVRDLRRRLLAAAKLTEANDDER